jgi:predicted nucleotidyltransferase component of viral defense system
MIGKNQIQDLANLLQMDKLTVFREYLQLLFLSYLYQERKAGDIVFKGGTALRLLFGSPRFSEDLDFSIVCADEEIGSLLKRLEKKIARELPGLKVVHLYSGKEGIRFRIKYSLPDFKYPFNIRLDFHRIDEIGDKQISTLTTSFPMMIFPQVFHLSQKGILVEKLEAVKTRCKGRDIFDVWFLLSKGTAFPAQEDDKEKIVKKIKLYSQAELERDLGKFLPKNQRTIIPYLKEETVKMLQNATEGSSILPRSTP